MKEDFKDLLKEVERLRALLADREKHIQVLTSEMKVLPSLIETNASSMLARNTQMELEQLKRNN